MPFAVETPVDSLAPWITPAVNGSILAMVGVFLLIVWPRWRKDQADEKELDRKAKVEEDRLEREERKAERELYKTNIEKVIEFSKTEQRYEREHCIRQFEQMMGKIGDTQDLLRQSLEAIKQSVERHHDFAVQSMASLRDKPHA